MAAGGAWTRLLSDASPGARAVILALYPWLPLDAATERKVLRWVYDHEALPDCSTLESLSRCRATVLAVIRHPLLASVPTDCLDRILLNVLSLGESRLAIQCRVSAVYAIRDHLLRHPRLQQVGTTPVQMRFYRSACRAAHRSLRDAAIQLYPLVDPSSRKQCQRWTSMMMSRTSAQVRHALTAVLNCDVHRPKAMWSTLAQKPVRLRLQRLAGSRDDGIRFLAEKVCRLLEGADSRRMSGR